MCARRRLLLDVRPVQSRCPSCRVHEIDKKGNHAITCHGAYSTSLRHHAIRHLIGEACRSAGFEVGYEHNGGLTDGRRPGDVIVRRWRLGKDLLIDCAVIDPTVDSHLSALVADPGEAATRYQQKKLVKYPDIDRKKFLFIPFILETHGAFGEAAVKFCKELHKRRKENLCIRDAFGGDREAFSKIDLVKAVTIEVRRWNANMVLDRSLRESISKPSDLTEVSIAVSKWEIEASEKLSTITKNPETIRTYWTTERKEMMINSVKQKNLALSTDTQKTTSEKDTQIPMPEEDFDDAASTHSNSVISLSPLLSADSFLRSEASSLDQNELSMNSHPCCPEEEFNIYSTTSASGNDLDMKVMNKR